MNPIAVLRRHFANVERSRQMLEEIREGIANLTDVTNRHLMGLAQIIEEAKAAYRPAMLPLKEPEVVSNACLRQPIPLQTAQHESPGDRPASRI
jgi:hypothetical protein